MNEEIPPTNAEIRPTNVSRDLAGQTRDVAGLVNPGDLANQLKRSQQRTKIYRQHIRRRGQRIRSFGEQICCRTQT